MNASLVEKTTTIVESRFLDFLLSEKVALSKLGLTKEKQEITSKRDLLDIEAKAIEKKEQAKQSAQGFKEYINEYFHDALFEHLEEKIHDSEFIMSELINVDPSVPKLFDASVTKAASAGQFDELIGQMTWLTKDVLNLVNNPPFRVKGTDRPYVEDIPLAVRYIGVDNIKYALLLYTARSWLPHSTEPFTDFKKRFWEFSLSCGNATRVLAKHHKVNETLAFLFGLIHGVGISMTLRLYLRAFDAVRISQMKKVLKEDRKDIEKTLHELELDPNFVEPALTRFSSIVTQTLLEQLKLKYAVLAPMAEELKDRINFQDASPMTRCLMQARAYVQYRMLTKARLIELDEAKALLSNYKLNNAIIAELNQVKLTKLNLIPKESK